MTVRIDGTGTSPDAVLRAAAPAPRLASVGDSRRRLLDRTREVSFTQIMTPSAAVHVAPGGCTGSGALFRVLRAVREIA